MANKFFSDIGGETIEVIRPRSMDKREFTVAYPDIKGVRVDNYSMWIGEDPSKKPRYDHENSKWIRHFVPVTRVVEYKNKFIKHECDARCMNASGRSMQCECACNGKNHGRGAFVCD